MNNITLHYEGKDIECPVKKFTGKVFYGLLDVINGNNDAEKQAEQIYIVAKTMPDAIDNYSKNANIEDNEKKLIASIMQEIHSGKLTKEDYFKIMDVKTSNNYDKDLKIVQYMVDTDKLREKNGGLAEKIDEDTDGEFWLNQHFDYIKSSAEFFRKKARTK